MCIFCKIVKKELPAKIIYEDDEILAFNDIRPLAPIHVLVVPKRHIESIEKLDDSEFGLAGKMIIVAKKIAAGSISPEIKTNEGYKLLFRVGMWGGQEVPHIHLHLIGGAKLTEQIEPL